MSWVNIEVWNLADQEVDQEQKALLEDQRDLMLLPFIMMMRYQLSHMHLLAWVGLPIYLNTVKPSIKLRQDPTLMTLIFFHRPRKLHHIFQTWTKKMNGQLFRISILFFTTKNRNNQRWESRKGRDSSSSNLTSKLKKKDTEREESKKKMPCMMISKLSTSSFLTRKNKKSKIDRELKLWERKRTEIFRWEKKS